MIILIIMTAIAFLILIKMQFFCDSNKYKAFHFDSIHAKLLQKIENRKGLGVEF